MHFKFKSFICVAIVFGVFCSTSFGGDNSVTFESLLNEMVDRDVLAKSLELNYTSQQASSYDRRQITPDDPAGWFANHDYENFIRLEKNQGREERVLMEHNGPGCVVRMWMPNMDKGTLRVYLDGSETPAIEAKFSALLTGADFVKPPLSYLAVRGGNLFLPIPYSKSCKIKITSIILFI